MSLAGDLSARTLDRITRVLGLVAVESECQPLVHAGSGAPLGELRVLAGGPVAQLVTISLSFDPIGLDSHMLFAFTAPDSALPHFTLDAVKAGPGYAYHLDLVSRVELGTHKAYMDHVFAPLTPAYDSGRAREGLTPAALSPRQYALMSPWMLVHRADEEAFAAVGEAVDAYVAHWLALCASGVPAGCTADMTCAELASRDRAHRANLFDPDIDPVWAMTDRLVGPEVNEHLRSVLKRPTLA